MKTFRKVMAILSALAVMSLSATAFAEVSGSFSGDVVTADLTNLNAAGGNHIVANVDATKAIVGQEMTFVVFNNDVTDLDIASGSITADDILYIDQKTLADTTEGKKFTGAINLSRVNGYESGDTLVDGSYPVRVGYYYEDPSEGRTFGIAAATIVVSSAADEPTTISVVWGDIDGDGVLSGFDVGFVLLGSLGLDADSAVLTDGVNSLTVEVGDTVSITDGENTESVTWGDIDGDDALSGFDVGYVLLGSLGLEAASNDIGSITLAVGDDISVVVPEE